MLHHKVIVTFCGVYLCPGELSPYHQLLLPTKPVVFIKNETTRAFKLASVSIHPQSFPQSPPQMTSITVHRPSIPGLGSHHSQFSLSTHVDSNFYPTSTRNLSLIPSLCHPHRRVVFSGVYHCTRLHPRPGGEAIGKLSGEAPPRLS